MWAVKKSTIYIFMTYVNYVVTIDEISEIYKKNIKLRTPKV